MGGDTGCRHKRSNFFGRRSPTIHLVQRRARLLVVRRTGWGKSLVYFLATRLLRDQGADCTILISPLLSLMIEAGLHRNEIDVLLISPGRPANDEFVSRCLLAVANRVGLFVVDEAHCISDWGHDIRPTYRGIVRILRALPRTIPVLATTATANDRVVGDIVEQLGPNLEVQRGPLTRASLSLQNISLRSQAARMAWLASVLENPCDKACRPEIAGRLLCREGRPDSSVGQRPSKDTDPNKKSLAGAHLPVASNTTSKLAIRQEAHQLREDGSALIHASLSVIPDSVTERIAAFQIAASQIPVQL
jgi:hypothetical protein